ncbi:hypothetical protein, partial [Fulvivirga aurantia]|uniref:hypothetical protein n=1 Tax=Fulvivirga aurantia TaxID=2529383 RepID=UPI0016288BA1
YKIATDQDLRETFINSNKEEYNATLVEDSIFNHQGYEVSSSEYVMQDSVTIKEVHFARGNYVYYWTSQYTGEPTEEIEKFLFQWEVLPWEEPDLVTYETDDFSMVVCHDYGYSGIESYDNNLDTLILHSSLDKTTGISTLLYEYDFNELGFFNNTDSLISYYSEGVDGKHILKVDSVNKEKAGYLKTVYQDSAYSNTTYEFIKWIGDKVYSLYVTTPVDIESSYAEQILESFTIKKSKPFNLFESKLDTLLNMVQSTDTAAYEQASGILANYPFINEDAYKLKEVLLSGILLDEGSWGSPGNAMIEAIGALEHAEAIRFYEELFAENPIYQSAVLEQLQTLQTELSFNLYKDLLVQKTSELDYSDFQVYRDSLSMLSPDLPMIMTFFEEPENRNIISSLLSDYNQNVDLAKDNLKPYEEDFSNSFRAVADTINIETDYNWDVYYLDRLLELSLASGAKAKSFKGQYDRLLKAKASMLQMVGLLGYLNADMSVKSKIVKEVLGYEEEAEFLLDRIEDKRHIDFITKYLDMVTISRMYIRSSLTYEDYYDVKMTYVDMFEETINDTKYSFYVFTFYDEYSETENISFSVYAMEDKKISTNVLYTDIYLGEHDPKDFENEKEAIIEDFKTYHLEM